METQSQNSYDELLDFSRENEVQVICDKNLVCTDTEPAVKDIANKYGKTTEQILLRWAIQRGTSVISQVQATELNYTNLDLRSFSLNNEEMCQIGECSKVQRFD